jgi:Protein phosphatase 2C
MSEAAMLIIDVLSLAGDAGNVNEDAWGTAGGHAWVIDGATGLGAKLLPGASDAAWFATALNDALASVDAEGARTRIAAAIERVRHSFEMQAARKPVGAWEVPCGSVILATAHTTHVELACLGDCTALIRGRDGTITSIGAGGEDAQLEAAKAVRTGASGQNGWLRSKATTEALRLSRENYNRPGGTWVARFEPDAADHAETLALPIESSVRLLMMTDGFAALAHRYRRYNHANLFAAAERIGLAALGKELRRIEHHEDPVGAQYKRFKQSDDATAILIEIRA